MEWKQWFILSSLFFSSFHQHSFFPIFEGVIGRVQLRAEDGSSLLTSQSESRSFPWLDLNLQPWRLLAPPPFPLQTLLLAGWSSGVSGSSFFTRVQEVPAALPAKAPPVDESRALRWRTLGTHPARNRVWVPSRGRRTERNRLAVPLLANDEEWRSCWPTSTTQQQHKRNTKEKKEGKTLWQQEAKYYN